MLKNVELGNYSTLGLLSGLTDTMFYLTGSRFFDPMCPSVTENSDWDFFAEFTPILKLWLEEQGFTMISTSDPNYVEIAGTQNIVCVLRKDTVDVQLVIDAPGKEWIQEQLKAFGRLLGKDKNQRKSEWRYAYKMAYGSEHLVKGIVIPSLSVTMDKKRGTTYQKVEQGKMKSAGSKDDRRLDLDDQLFSGPREGIYGGSKV